MSRVDAKKADIIERVAHHLLIHGLQEAGIRRLAEASGCSDRMLIYYFGSKDTLISLTLQSIADGVTQQLDALLGTHKRTHPQLLDELTQVTSDQQMMPAVQLWFELVGHAARGKEPYATSARRLATNWIDWIDSRLRRKKSGEARQLYAMLEGRLMLRLIDGP